MKFAVLRAGRVGALLALALALVFAFRVPQSLANLKTKHETMRRLQQENADIEGDIARMKDHVRKLEKDRAAQELEVRKQLGYQRQGETTIILPDQKPAK